MALLAIVGCSSTRDDTLRRLETAVARGTPAAWGEAAVPEVLAAERAMFGCLWDRLPNPEEEFACRIANLEAANQCVQREGGGQDALKCWAPERLPCTVSRAFREADTECAALLGYPRFTP